MRGEINPRDVCLFVGPGLKAFKLDLFMRIGRKIEKMGGSMIHGDFEAVKKLPDSVVPIVGCSPELRQSIKEWTVRGRAWIYWDRGYARRVFATWLPRGSDGGYYRWHVGAYQMTEIFDAPSDRWDSLKTDVAPWQRGGREIHIAGGSPTYNKFHELPQDWAQQTADELRKHTDRPITISDKESKVPLSERVRGIHALVTHGSNAANEAVVMGCPVFCSSDCAAALVGRTDLSQIEDPAYPDRQPWLNAIAYSQFSEAELVDGTLWRLLR